MSTFIHRIENILNQLVKVMKKKLLAFYNIKINPSSDTTRWVLFSA